MSSDCVRRLTERRIYQVDTKTTEPIQKHRITTHVVQKLELSTAFRIEQVIEVTRLLTETRLTSALIVP